MKKWICRVDLLEVDVRVRCRKWIWGIDLLEFDVTCPCVGILGWVLMTLPKMQAKGHA